MIPTAVGQRWREAKACKELQNTDKQGVAQCNAHYKHTPKKYCPNVQDIGYLQSSPTVALLLMDRST
jgi:hypothetical protein